MNAIRIAFFVFAAALLSTVTGVVLPAQYYESEPSPMHTWMVVMQGSSPSPLAVSVKDRDIYPWDSDETQTLDPTPLPSTLSEPQASPDALAPADSNTAASTDHLPISAPLSPWPSLSAADTTKWKLDQYDPTAKNGLPFPSPTPLAGFAPQDILIIVNGKPIGASPILPSRTPTHLPSQTQSPPLPDNSHHLLEPPSPTTTPVPELPSQKPLSPREEYFGIRRSPVPIPTHEGIYSAPLSPPPSHAEIASSATPSPTPEGQLHSAADTAAVFGIKPQPRMYFVSTDDNRKTTPLHDGFTFCPHTLSFQGFSVTCEYPGGKGAKFLINGKQVKTEHVRPFTIRGDEHGVTNPWIDYPENTGVRITCVIDNVHEVSASGRFTCA